MSTFICLLAEYSAIGLLRMACWLAGMAEQLARLLAHPLREMQEGRDGGKTSDSPGEKAWLRCEDGD